MEQIVYSSVLGGLKFCLSGRFLGITTYRVELDQIVEEVESLESPIYIEMDECILRDNPVKKKFMRVMDLMLI